MAISHTYFQRLLLIYAAFIVIASSSSYAAGPEQDSRDAAAERSLTRLEFFLLREYDELNKYQEYEKAAIEQLEKRSTDWKHMRNGAGQLLDWHRGIARWLADRVREAESDLEVFYLSSGQAYMNNRYAVMASDYARLAEQLDQLAARFDESKARNAAGIRKRNNIVEYYEYMMEEAEKRKTRNEKWNPGRLPPEDWILYYKDMDEETVRKIRNEITALEEQQKELGLLLNLGQYEIDWIKLKAGDSKSLDPVFEAAQSDSLTRVAETTNGMIRQYESDITVIQKLLHNLDQSRPRLGDLNSGSLRSLNRDAALSDYTFALKTRWEHHQQWLKEQIGGYRADMVLLQKERSKQR